MADMIDNYRLERQLGQGGMGTVYLATDLNLQRQVALKLMHPHLASQAEFQQRFLQEARAAASLDHPHIIKVLYFGLKDGQLFLVTDFVAGGSLRDYIKHLNQINKPMDLMEAVELTRQIAEALNYAHGQGMVHRDIKPDNVLLKPVTSGTGMGGFMAILTDFGLAKLNEALVHTATGQTMGTFAYMSPEQCLGESVDARSDLYSLGIMLYELVARRLPFPAKTISEAIRMHSQEPLPPPEGFRPGLPPTLGAVINKALAKKPEDRYSSAAEMMTALQTLLSGGLPQSAPASPPSLPSTLPESAPTRPESILTYLASQAPMGQMPAHTIQAPTPSQVGQDRLIVVSEGGAQTVLINKSVMIFGRDSAADVILRGEKVSRNHTRLDRRPDGSYTITDLGSTNGTFLNDAKMLPNMPQAFEPGMNVRIGEFWIRLETARSRADIPATPSMAQTLVSPKAPSAPAVSVPPAPPPPTLDFGASLYPPQLKGAGTLMLTLNNKSSIPASFGVRVNERGGLVDFAQPAPTTLGVGETQIIPIPAAPRQRPTFGGAGVAPFEVVVEMLPNPAGGVQPGALAPQVLSGEMLITPSIPVWMLPAAVFACAILAALAVGVLSIVNNQNQQRTVVAVGNVQTQTALATRSVSPTFTPSVTPTSTATPTSTPDYNATFAFNVLATQNALDLTATAAVGGAANAATATAIANQQATLQALYNQITATAISAYMTLTMQAQIQAFQATQMSIAATATSFWATANAATAKAAATATGAVFATATAQANAAASQTAIFQTATALAGAVAATQTQAAINANTTIQAALTQTQAAINNQATIVAAANATQTQAAVDMIATANAVGTANAGAAAATAAAAAATATAQAQIIEATNAAAATFAVETATMQAAIIDATNAAAATFAAGTATVAAMEFEATATMQALIIEATNAAAATATANALLNPPSPTPEVIVPPASPFLLQHMTSPANISGNFTTLDNPSWNGNAGLFLFTTLQLNPSSVVNNPNPTGVFFTGSQWAIFNQDGGQPMPAGALYSAYSPPSGSFVFTHSASGDGSHITFIDRPELNGNPSLIVMVEQTFGSGVYNNHLVGVWYDGSRWAIFNQDQQPLPAGATFNVLVIPGGGGAYTHVAAPENTSGDRTFLSHPQLDGRPDAVFIVTTNYTPGSVYMQFPVAVTYDSGTGRWAVVAQPNGMGVPEVPFGSAYNIVIVN